MIKNLKDLFSILRLVEINNFYNLSIFIFINTFFELLSLGLLIPIISSYLNTEILNNFFAFIINLEIKFLSNFFLSYKNHFLKILIIALFFIYTIKYIINLLFNYYLSSIKIFYEKKIANAFLLKLFSSSNLSVLNLPKSEILQHINSRTSLIATAITNVSNLIVEAVVLLSLSIYFLLKIGSTSFYILGILFFISFFLFKFIKRKALQWSEERGKGGNLRSKTLLDFLEGARELIIFGSFDSLFKEFKINNKRFLEPSRKVNFWNSVPKILLEYLLLVLVLFYLFYNVYFGLEYQKTISNIAIILVVLLRAIPSLNRIIYHYSQFRFAIEPIQTIKKLFEDSYLEPKEKIGNKIDFKNELVIKNINFQYNKDSKIFDLANLNIKKNSKVAIIGETGVGKSTLIDIIAGLKKPNNGEINLDDKSLKDVNKNSWLKNIAYTSQRVYLFNSSIRNNITFQSDSENIDEIKFNEVIKLAGLTDLIKNKEEKEFGSVGEFGNKVSGGQRQKIGIARALYSNRSILIFDESTNSMDHLSANKIVDQIYKLKDKTIIFITHSNDLAKKFDEIYILKNKKIVKTN